MRDNEIVIIMARTSTVMLARMSAVRIWSGNVPEMFMINDIIKPMDSIIALLAKIFLIRIRICRAYYVLTVMLCMRQNLAKHYLIGNNPINRCLVLPE
jgi:hypothetical protein